MISLRKAIDTSLEQAFAATMAAYRALLTNLGATGARVYPPGGEQLQQDLHAVHESLTADAAPAQIDASEKAVEAALVRWGERAVDHGKKQSDELKQLLSMLATAATEMGARDERFSTQFRTFADDLQATTRLNDLSSIRRVLSKSVTNMKACVTEMAKDNQDAVTKLRAQITAYEGRLEEIERIACTDRLTGLANRQKIETYLERRTREDRHFSIVYLDLNGFKRINDNHGHLAGDDLLKQFAGELRMACRPSDLVGRWGGDEFVVIVDGDLPEANALTGRIERWVTGKYNITTETTPKEVTLTAAIGLATWTPGESITSVFHRADAAMYEQKPRHRS